MVTSQRFGQRRLDPGCRLGCDAEDTIKHYANCRAAAPLARSWLGLTRKDTPAERLEDLLLITRFDPADELRKRAIWTGSLYKWYNLCSHSESLSSAPQRLEALAHCLRDTIGGTNTTR